MNHIKQPQYPLLVSKFFEVDGKLYRIQLWDLVGQDKSASITKIFARDAHGCMVVTDATVREKIGLEV